MEHTLHTQSSEDTLQARSTWAQVLSQPAADVAAAKQALLWLTFAHRPLSTSELLHAVATSPIFNENNIPSTSRLLSICCGLVTIDEKTDTVKFTDATACSFFRSIVAELSPGHSPHAQITTGCLTYLTASGFPNAIGAPQRPISRRHDLNTFLSHRPFLNYAYHYWGEHAQVAMLEEDGPEVQVRIGSFLQEATPYPWIYHDQDDVYDAFDLLTLPHVAACYGLSYYLPTVLEERHTKTQLRKRTPLHLSARYGHAEFISALLANPDMDVNQGDARGQTPLMLASNTHEEAAKILISSPDIDINRQDSRGFTSFLRACQSGNLAIAKLHLTDPVSVRVLRKATQDGRIPLCQAVASGSKELVQLLLSEDTIDVNQRDQGSTPLIRACSKGYTEIVNTLLQHPNIEINKEDEHGSSALHHAITYKHESAVTLLLAREDLDVNKDNSFGNTPLTLAAQSGQTGLVHALLRRPDIDVSKPKTNSQQTPHHLATTRKHLACANLLADHVQNIKLQA